MTAGKLIHGLRCHLESVIIIGVDRLSQFSQQRYLNLETYRKNGTPVRTPLWFVRRGSALFMRTPTDSFKVRRIGNNPRVKIIPCTMRGHARGTWLQERAELRDADESMDWLNTEFRRKYGVLKRLIDLYRSFKPEPTTVIRVGTGSWDGQYRDKVAAESGPWVGA